MATATAKNGTGTKVCPACGGRRMVANAQTGSAEACPICQGAGAVRQDVDPWFFDYVFDGIVNPTGLAAGSSPALPITKQLATDSAFEWLFIVASFTSALLNVQMLDSSRSSQPLSDAPVNINNWAGTAQQPFPLVFAYYFPPGTSVTLKFLDSSGAANTVEVVMRGHKLYPKLRQAAA